MGTIQVPAEADHKHEYTPRLLIDSPHGREVKLSPIRQDGQRAFYVCRLCGELGFEVGQSA